MGFPSTFFTLQWEFAQRMAALEDLELPTALMAYTYYYISFGLGRDFDPENPIWQTYLSGQERCPDGAAWSHQFYRQRQIELPPRQVENAFGCFSYTM